MNNKNTIIGLLLIFGIFVVYSLLMTPSKKEMEPKDESPIPLLMCKIKSGKHLLLHRHVKWPLNRQEKN